jgi:hypothetical protein
MPSAIQPRLIEAPGSGLIRNADPRHVPDRAWSNGRNIRFPTGSTRVRKTDGYQRVDTTSPPEPIQALWWYVPLVGDARLIRLTLTSATIGFGALRDEIVAYPPASVGTIDRVVSLDQFEDHLIWSIDGLAVWTWDGSANDAVLLNTKTEGDPPVLSGSPTGRIVEIHKEHVLIANITEPSIPGTPQPWTVAWSTRGHPFDWTSDSAGDMQFLEDSTPITALKVLGDHAIVHKPNRLYRMIFVGPPDYYVPEGIPADDGAISARAPISIGAYQFYMGRTNFYRLASFSEPIGDAIWPEVQAAIDWSRAGLIYAYRRLEWDEVCWKIPTRGSAQPNLTVIFNYRDQTWTLTDHDPGTCFTEVPADILPAAVGNLATPPVRGIFGQADGDLHVYGGPNAWDEPIHAWVESRHFTDGVIPAKILAVPVFATGQGILQVSLRSAMEARHPMPAWPPARPLPLAPSQTRPWVDVREYGRIWQIRLESTEMDDTWEVTAYGAAVIPQTFAR